MAALHPALPATAPHPVAAATMALPLHDAANSRQIEAQALADAADHALMARAGLAVARLALALAPHARRVGVLAGPGNNGGDGLIAAAHLHRLGRQVRIVHLADPTKLPVDACDALHQLHRAGLQPGAPDGSLMAVLACDLLIDGLLGLGAGRAPGGDIAAAIAAINTSGRPVLAIDLPSGLNADTGMPWGEAAVRADWTLSLLTLKPGLFTALGRDLAGAVWHDDLGVATPVAPSAWLGACTAPPPPGFAPRHHAQHKGSFGDLVVIGGADGMCGAVDLAAGAALRAGAGRVYKSLLVDGARAVTGSGRPELMLRAQAWLDDRETLRRSTVVCGCGGGPQVAAVLPPLLDRAGRLLLDADALNAVAHDPGLQAALQRRAARGEATMLTPHPLEAARLLACSTAQVQADRIAAATQLAQRFGAVVVLKGSGSVVCAPQRLPWINASGNARLATPGSGDVLAGWIGGLWAQAATPDGTDTASAWWAARSAVWLHGHAADRALAAHPAQAHLPLLAADLIGAMADALG